MFGGALSIPIPDVDRTEHLLILGANPLASNGSLMTAPDMRGRLRRAPRARRQGRRHRPAPQPHRRGGRRAPLHPARHRRPAAVRDGAHALRRGPGRRSATWTRHLNGLEEVREAAGPFTPEAVAGPTGIAADGDPPAWRASLPAAERAAVYGRIGTCTQEFGTLASWLVDVLNVLTGNLDREGGAMFTAGRRRAGQLQRRARPRPRLPARALGQPRAAACRRRSASCRSPPSPRRSTRRARARSGRCSRSPATRRSRRPTRSASTRRSPRSTSWSASTSTSTRPPATPTSSCPAPRRCGRSHYDVALYQLAVRNVANYSPPVLEPRPRAPGRVAVDAAPDRRSSPARAPDADVDAIDDFVAAEAVKREVGDAGIARWRAATPASCWPALEPRARPRAPARPDAAQPGPTATASARTPTG